MYEKTEGQASYENAEDQASRLRQQYGRLQVLEREGEELSLSDRLRAMNRPLLAWYEAHARVLPWREDPEPYRVWISEIMLQQTRVEAVKPYFERFMEALPDAAALASVEDDRLMKLWEGLGYYNRARNLKKAAIEIQERFGGRMPSEYEDLLSLPGIGSYTAGAIASIAFGRPVPAVDGNVLRVISRVTASREDILKASTKRWMEEELRRTMPQDAASAFNQGLIEIGAIVCVPNGPPKCGACPLASICLARKQDLIGEIPVKTPPKKRRLEERTVLILEHAGQVGLRKREDTGLLASLYELPNVEGIIKAGGAGRGVRPFPGRGSPGGGPACGQAYLFPRGVAYEGLPGHPGEGDPGALSGGGQGPAAERLCPAQCIWQVYKADKRRIMRERR